MRTSLRIMQLNFSIHVDLCKSHVTCILIKPLMFEKTKTKLIVLEFDLHVF